MSERERLVSLLAAVEAELRARARLGGSDEDRWRNLIVSRTLHNAIIETEAFLREPAPEGGE